MTDSRVLNAIIGAVVTLLLSFTGASPIIGGGVAAWLEGGDKSDSIRIGILSGLIALLPLLLMFALVLGLLGTGFVGMGRVSVAVVFFAIAVGLTGLVIVGLSALGGYLAYYLMKDDRLPNA